ncbi:hypothetical protein [Aliikangiella sp. IMCC44359]|uniref:hypothetical protein n=1 Tax=Aliikangiella sp. IMCC44359 TaxID=3459125 RepID=UPI00403AA66F
MTSDIKNDEGKNKDSKDSGIEINITLNSPSISGELLTDVEVLIFNTENQLVYQSYNEANTKLAQGLYRVRTRAFGLSAEELIEVNNNSHLFSINTPRRATAIPDGISIGSHEYYQAEFFSNRNHLSVADAHLNDGQQCLYLFVRMPGAEYARSINQGHPLNLLADCWIENQQGEIMIEFTEGNVQSNKIGTSWYRMPIEPGFYRLFNRDKNGKRSWMPIHVYPSASNSNYRYHTEVAFIWREGLRFDTAVMATPWEHINEHDYTFQLEQTDASLQSLAAGERSELITSKLVNRMLTDKFVNPLQGIIACHLMLMRDKPNTDNIEYVLDNIQNLVAYSPDIDVLRYRVAKLKQDKRKHDGLTGENLNAPILQALPLFREGFLEVGAKHINHKAQSIVQSFLSSSMPSMMGQLESQIADYMVYRDLRSPWLKTRPHTRSLFDQDIAKKLQKKAIHWGSSLLGIETHAMATQDDNEQDLINIPSWITDTLTPIKKELELKKDGDNKPNFQALSEKYDLPEMLVSFAWDKISLKKYLKH